ncbi:MAG: hypothetical protein K0R15_2413 [Clostridiales bacterium]|jgi:hypothetical protein|nr:hypothetical protein [Clostridiales bacterium]
MGKKLETVKLNFIIATLFAIINFLFYTFNFNYNSFIILMSVLTLYINN